MISPADKDLLEALSYLATLIGIPIAICVFVYQKHRERLDREIEVHAAAHDRYIAYLTLCLEHPELDGFDVPEDASDVKECAVPYRTLILYTILISIMESAFVRYNASKSGASKRQWEGWKAYLEEWAGRSTFQRAWPVIGPQFSPDFVSQMTSLIARAKALRDPE